LSGKQRWFRVYKREGGAAAAVDVNCHFHFSLAVSVEEKRIWLSERGRETERL